MDLYWTGDRAVVLNDGSATLVSLPLGLEKGVSSRLVENKVPHCCPLYSSLYYTGAEAALLNDGPATLVGLPLGLEKGVSSRLVEEQGPSLLSSIL